MSFEAGGSHWSLSLFGLPRLQTIVTHELRPIDLDLLKLLIERLLLEAGDRSLRWTLPESAWHEDLFLTDLLDLTRDRVLTAHQGAVPRGASLTHVFFA